MGIWVAVGIGFLFVLYYSRKAKKKIEDWENNKKDENKKEP